MEPGRGPRPDLKEGGDHLARRDFLRPAGLVGLSKGQNTTSESESRPEANCDLGGVVMRGREDGGEVEGQVKGEVARADANHNSEDKSH